jgi:hypothetical protein
LIIFKGFSNQQEQEEYTELLSCFRFIKFDIPDDGFDLTAYLEAVKRYSNKYRYFCFLNSFSVILDHNWLEKLYCNVIKPGVGMVGASASWQSHRGWIPFWRATLAVNREYFKKPQDVIKVNENKYYSYSLASRIYSYFRWSLFLLSFDPAPNFHIRTNSFMIASDIIKTLNFPSIITKADAYKYESGKCGLNKHILKMGKKLVLVGKNGIGYEKEKWNSSNTFWQSQQENLLVADNQTRDYQHGSFERRSYLKITAWGP